MLDLNPAALPYTFGEINDALNKISEDELTSVEQSWIKRVKNRIYTGKQNFSSKKTGIELMVDETYSNSKRLDVIRPLREGKFMYHAAKLSGYVGNDYFIGQFNITQSIYYDQDPDGFDVGRRLYIRSDDSYLGFRKEKLSIFLGRYNHHWAPYNESSTILSDNPRSFDLLNLNYKSDYFEIRSVLGELDGINQNENFTGTATALGSKNRFITTHMITLSPVSNFHLSFFESILYSGFDSSFSLRYANPLLVFGFDSDNLPKNDEVNLLMGGSMWWQIKNLTLHGQLMLDDIHIKRDEETTTFSLTGSANYANIRPALDAGYELEMVAYQTYNSPQPEGRYIYLGRGLATFGNDYIYNKLFLNYYADSIIKGLTIKPTFHYLMQGEQTINQEIVRTNPDGTLIDIILTGTVEKTLRAGLDLFYSPTQNFWFHLDTGFNTYQNRFNIPGNSDSNFSTTFNIGFRISLDKPTD